MRQPYATDITKEQFKHIEPILTSVRKKTKPTKIDIYDVFCAIKYVLNTGCQWRNIPHDFPKWQTVYSYYQKWSEIDEQGDSAIATADITDREGGIILLKRQRISLAQVQNIMADGGYTGDNFANAVKDTLGEKVTVEIAKRSELHKFVVIPKRWVVERSFAWLEKNRRLWKNCERKLNSSLQMVNLAFLCLLLKRL